MKKLLLAVLISGVGLNAAQAAPTVYGKLHVGVTSTDAFSDKTNSKGAYAKGDSKPVAQVDSFASRFGVKGSEKLTDNLSAIYGIEWQVTTDGDGTDLTQRNRFVGLGYDGIGAVKVGKLDSPLKNIQNKVDIFKDMGYLDHANLQAGENRLNNVVAFESDPKALKGLAFNVTLQQAENTNLAGANSENVKRNLGSAVSASATYENKDLGVYAGVAGDQNVVSKFAATGKSAETQAIRAVGALNVGQVVDALNGLNVSVLLQTAKPVHLSAAAKAKGGDFYHFDREDSFIVSGGYSIPNSPITLKAQYGQSKTQFDGSSPDIKLEIYGAQAEYKFNSKARTYVFLAQSTSDAKDSKTGLETADRTVGGVGLEYNF